MKLLLRLKIWFYSRKQIMDEVQSLTEMLDIQMSKYLDKIEALDQNKIYVIYAKNATPKELKAFRCALREFDKRLKWTMPHIIIINNPIRQMTKEELKIIADSIGITEAGNNIQTHNKT